jgi:glycosyltransferase involved in cell wall biosynthesis
MGAPRIAVVVPCYNDGATVGETVDSVREAEPVEIIVVDDGSRDPATVALLDRLAGENRIQLVRKANGGVASALRAGFEAARTPYVFVLASDDLADAGALAELADALDRSPGHDFAYGHSHHFGDVDFVRRAAPWNPWILLYSNLWEAACLFRREAVIAVGGFPDGTGYEDWALFMALAERGSTGVLVDRLVFHYRIHGGGRVNQGAKLRLREHYLKLRRDHRALFARERELRRRYPLPLWSRLLYRLQLAAALWLPPGLVRALLNLKYRLRPLVGWVDAARR